MFYYYGAESSLRSIRVVPRLINKGQFSMAYREWGYHVWAEYSRQDTSCMGTAKAKQTQE